MYVDEVIFHFFSGIRTDIKIHLLQADYCEVKDIDFDPAFINQMLSKLDWKALYDAAQKVGKRSVSISCSNYQQGRNLTAILGGGEGVKISD